MPRRIARFTAIVVAVLVAMLTAVAPARAGGPTSVLVVDYEGSRAAAALSGSTAYDGLARALDALSGTAPTGTTAGPTEFMGAELRLVWLIHDVTPWRIDALRIAPDGIWVNTVVNTQGDLVDESGTWHRPMDEALLRRTLTALGVLGPVTAASASPPVAPTLTPASPPRAGLPPWTIAGTAMVTLILGVLAGRLSRRSSASGPEEPTMADDQTEAASRHSPESQRQAPADAASAAYRSTPIGRFTLR